MFLEYVSNSVLVVSKYSVKNAVKKASATEPTRAAARANPPLIIRDCVSLSV